MRLLASPLTAAVLVFCATAHAGQATSHQYAFTAELDSSVRSGTTEYSLAIPGVGADFEFVHGASWVEYSDGRASLNGRVARRSNPRECWLVDLEFSDRIAPGDPGYRISVLPALELAAHAYASNGGPIDPFTWTHYRAVDGILVGVDDLEGARAILWHRGGPAVQVGAGANNMNLGHGSSGKLLVRIQGQPIVPRIRPLPQNWRRAFLNVDLTPERALFPRASEIDPDLYRNGGFAGFALPGIGEAFRFVRGTEFIEYGDGTARLLGLVQHEEDAARAFWADVLFEDRRSPLASNFPAAGGPVKELAHVSYQENGGWVGSDGWHYYATASGHLLGREDFAGAVYAFDSSDVALQLGDGANNRNGRFGAFGEFDVTLLTQAHRGAPLPDVLVAELHADLDGRFSPCVRDADADAYTQSSAGYTLWLPPYGNFDLVSGGRFTEHLDGTAHVSGVVRGSDHPEMVFEFDFEFRERVNPGGLGHHPPFSPKKEMPQSSYVENGGPVNPDDWHYYLVTEGRLRGLDALEGAELSLQRYGPAFQVGFGASGKNIRFGAAGWLEIQLASQPLRGNFLAATYGSHGDINIDLDDECVACVQAAVQDPDFGLDRGPGAFWMQDVGGDFVFVSGASFVERSDGSAHLTGMIARSSDPSQRFAVDFHFFDRITPGSPDHAPTGSPKLGLPGAVYAFNGGTIDPSQWEYYPAMSGTLTGFGTFEGAVISVGRMGPAFQVGRGASNKSERFGGSGWHTLEVLSQPTTGYQFSATFMQGDSYFEIVGECAACIEDAEPQPGMNLQQTQAVGFRFPFLGEDYHFVNGGNFIELSDGTAHVAGLLVNSNDATEAWMLELFFEERLDPGDVGHVPPGSPKRELAAHAYVENGGPIVTDTWRYYAVSYGTMVGHNAFSGAVLTLDRIGPAFQVGVGANGRNYDWGASGWFDVNVAAQPQNGPVMASSLGMGDINISIVSDCVDTSSL